jgi:hypothetical protein
VEEGESSIELLEYSLRANYSLDRSLEENELGNQYDNEQLMDISANEPIADTPHDEDEEHRKIRRAKNASALNTSATRRNVPANQGISTMPLQ